MADQAFRLLNAFAQTANKTVLRPEDWQRFFEFVVMVHTDTWPITGCMVKTRLLSFGFPLAQADQLSAEFARYCELLAMYDRQRTQHPLT